MPAKYTVVSSATSTVLQTPSQYRHDLSVELCCRPPKGLHKHQGDEKTSEQQDTEDEGNF